MKRQTKRGRIENVRASWWLMPIAVVTATIFARRAFALGPAGIPEVWQPLSLAALLGGVGILLIGMEMLSDSLKRLAGDRLPAILRSLTRHRVIGLITGIVITATIQSSSATTVILVSLVQSELMSFTQSIPVILGANVGTTISAQIIAFKVTDYALLFIGVGFVLRYVKRPSWMKFFGEALLGVGLAFFGLRIMSDAMHPLRDSPMLTGMISMFDNVAFGVLVGAVFTALIQSSAATLGILITFTSQGWLTLESSIPIILGANIGTSVTAVLASLANSRESKRVAAVHVLVNIGGAFLVVFWIPTFADLVRWASTLGSETVTASLPRQVANAHTLFNLGVAGVFLPFTGVIAAIARKVIPDRPDDLEAAYRFDRNLLTSFAGTPELALAEAFEGVRRAVDWTNEILDAGFSIISKRTKPDLDTVREIRHRLSRLRDALKDYLNELSLLQLTDTQSLEATNMMLVINELDHIAQVMMTLAFETHQEEGNFSEEGRQELEDYLNETMTVFRLATEAFLEKSVEKAQAAGDYKRALKPKEDQYRRSHIRRMTSHVAESIQTDSLHMDLLDALRQVNTYSGRIARILLSDQREEEEDERHATQQAMSA